MVLVLVLVFHVLLRMESATVVEGEKSSALAYACLMLILTVGTCCIVYLLGWVGCVLQFSGCNNLEIEMVLLSMSPL